MKRYALGIDPSINSTGVCLSDMDTCDNIYYIISSKVTQKSIKYAGENQHINIYQYDKQDVKNVTQYYVRENIKMSNLLTVVDIIYYIIKDILSDGSQIEYVVMEGVSYGSVKGSALIDLSFLNALIRNMLRTFNIKLYVVAPTEVKKYAVGNGSADKETMIMSWKQLDTNISDIPDWFKCDDIADAYFMAHYNPENMG